jgi:hypothetical protein
LLFRSVFTLLPHGTMSNVVALLIERPEGNHDVAHRPGRSPSDPWALPKPGDLRESSNPGLTASWHHAP